MYQHLCPGKTMSFVDQCVGDISDADLLKDGRKRLSIQGFGCCSDTENEHSDDELKYSSRLY